LNVSASDKTTGKSNHITITNDKDHLLKEEIERTVSEAEKYKGMFLLFYGNFQYNLTFFFIAEDEAAVARVQAKNAFETYVCNLCNSINEEMLAGKFDPADKLKFESVIARGASW
jgi:heat shock protein 1/8